LNKNFQPFGKNCQKTEDLLTAPAVWLTLFWLTLYMGWKPLCPRVARTDGLAS